MKKQKPNETRITVRFPSDLIREIRHLAPLHDRSINSEIVQAVRFYIAAQQREEKQNGKTVL